MATTPPPLTASPPTPDDAPDAAFYDRADAHIALANQQIGPQATRGNVSASMLFATARFNAWASACGSDDAGHLARVRADLVRYHVEQYQRMLIASVDDYILNFDKYMKG